MNAPLAGLRVFRTEEDLQDFAESLNQAGLHPDVPIMDSNGAAMLACRTAPGGDGRGFAYYTAGEDGFMHPEGCCECENPRRDWKPTFPVVGIVRIAP